MASWWTVVLIFQIGALWEYTGATSCTDLTKKTCTPTLHVTGTCTNSVCDCMSGLVSTRIGCSGVVKPKINIIPKLGSTDADYATKSIGSGEVLLGKDIKLVCIPNYGDGFYVWTKDELKVDGQANSVFTLTASAVDKTGNYKCKVKFPTLDFETTESEAVRISVIDDTTATFQIRPKVSGMPARAFASSQLSLECVNLPSGMALTYEWNDGAVLTDETQLISVATPSTSKAYTCSYTSADTASTLPAASDTVNSPATATTSIAGVFLSIVNPSTLPADPNGPRPDVPPIAYAEAGSALTVYCAINDTDLVVPTSAITLYEWKKDGIAQTGSTNTFTIASLQSSHQGSYTCSATVGGQVSTSKAVQLNVESKLIESVTTVVIPPKPVIGGYAVIDCQVKTSDLRRVSYSWTRGGNTLWNVTDRALQINGLTATNDNAVYVCTANVGLDSGSDSETLTAADLTSERPAVTSNVGNGLYGLGNKYTLTCGDAYTIPGLTYKWYENDNQVTGQTSKTYEITVKTGTTAYTCDIALGSTTSLKSNPGVSVIAKQLLAVYYNVGTVTVTGTYNPVTTTSVTLTCVATTAAGASGTVTYSWTKGSTATGSGTSTLTFDAGTNTNGDYVCRATIGTEYLESTLTVTSSATVAKPVIVEASDTYNGGASFSYSEGGNYVLTCVTASHSPSLIYAWTKGSNTVGNSRVYQITSAKKGATGDDGSYICSAKSGDQTAVASDAVTITIGDKGKPCLYVNDCDGDQYADVCENSRCVCATGYTLQGNTCSGQGIVTISMLLLVLCGVIKLIM